MADRYATGLQGAGLSGFKALQKRITELERALGRREMDVAILKEAVVLAREKKQIWPEPLSDVACFL